MKENANSKIIFEKEFIALFYELYDWLIFKIVETHYHGKDILSPIAIFVDPNFLIMSSWMAYKIGTLLLQAISKTILLTNSL